MVRENGQKAEHISHEDRLKELPVVQPGGVCSSDLIIDFWHLKGVYKKDEGGLLKGPERTGQGGIT